MLDAWKEFFQARATASQEQSWAVPADTTKTTLIRKRMAKVMTPLVGKAHKWNASNRQKASEMSVKLKVIKN